LDLSWPVPAINMMSTAATTRDRQLPARSYRIYGLNLRSDIALDGAEPLVAPAGAEADCELHTGPFTSPEALEQIAEVDGDDVVTVSRIASGTPGYLLEYSDGNRFLIEENGARIYAHWPDSSTAEDMVTYLVGPVLAFVLRLRGTFSLHASAVVVDDGALALVGESGAGKSSTAAAFADSGAAVLTDDIVAFSWRGEEAWVESGYPRLRLWPNIVEARYGNPDALPRLTRNWEKRYLDLASVQRFAAEALPVRAILILGPRVDGSPKVERIGTREAALALIANSSMSRHLSAELRRQELVHVASLLTKVPVFRAQASCEVTLLPQFCAAIRAALRTI